MKLVIATKNKGKIAEITDAFKGLPVQVISLLQFDGAPDVVEDGGSFRENAEKKAKAIAAFTALPALADDSGLVVDALGGEPGIFSARYAGPHARDEDNTALVLEKMSGLPAAQRTARFVCDLALALPDGRIFHTEGICGGLIAVHPAGTQGFGYDPVFIVPELGMTMAEIPLEKKNTLSHRARAVEKMYLLIEALLAEKH